MKFAKVMFLHLSGCSQVGGWSLHPGGSISGGVGQTPCHWILQDTVNEQVVCILLKCIFVFIIITSGNEVVAKVIFLHLSVILFRGGCLPQCMLGYHTPGAGTPPGADTPRADTLQDQTPPGPDTPQTRHPQDQTPPGRSTPPGLSTPPWTKYTTRTKYTPQD